MSAIKGPLHSICQLHHSSLHETKEEEEEEEYTIISSPMVQTVQAPTTMTCTIAEGSWERSEDSTEIQSQLQAVTQKAAKHAICPPRRFGHAFHQSLCAAHHVNTELNKIGGILPPR